jgi:hypothetical protein
MAGPVLGALRDLVLTVAIALGLVGFVFGMAYVPYYVLLALPDPMGQALCGSAFFCWPTLLAGGIVSVSVGLVFLGWLTSRESLRLPEVW